MKSEDRGGSGVKGLQTIHLLILWQNGTKINQVFWKKKEPLDQKKMVDIDPYIINMNVGDNDNHYCTIVEELEGYEKLLWGR